MKPTEHSMRAAVELMQGVPHSMKRCPVEFGMCPWCTMGQKIAAAIDAAVEAERVRAEGIVSEYRIRYEKGLAELMGSSVVKPVLIFDDIISAIRKGADDGKR